MENRRIVITGVGVAGDFGSGKDAFLDFAENRAPAEEQGEVNIDSYVDMSLLRRADKNSCFASVAAKMAIDDAGGLGSVPPERRGLVLAATHGPIGYAQEYHREMVLGEPAMVSPLLFSNSLPSTMASYITNIFDIRGYTTTLSGYNAVMSAVKCARELLRDGVVDVCLAGGVDIFDKILLEAYSMCRANTREISRYFGGSGIVVLEPRDLAVKRGANRYAEVAGSEISVGSRRRSAGNEILPVERLLRKAGLSAQDIGIFITSSFDENGCYERQKKYIEKFTGVTRVMDVSGLFGDTFSAGEIFKTIYGVFLAGRHSCNVVVGSVSKLGSDGSLLLVGKDQ